MRDVIVIATRKSKLALRQTGEIINALAAAHPALTFRSLALSSRGDEITDRALAPLGGKGLFVTRLERALADGEARLAVHSLKDVPSELPHGFSLAAIPIRADPRDVLIVREGDHIGKLDNLPHGARVGTASLRRQAQLLHARPDLDVVVLRGSVETRLARLDAGDLDATVLAAAGLARLGIVRGTPLGPDTLLPASGQGALAVETRSDDEQITALVSPLEDRAARTAATAERAFCRALGASCASPVAALATISGGKVALSVRVLPADGSDRLAAEGTAPIAEAESLGIRLARDLLARGASRWLGNDSPA